MAKRSYAPRNPCSAKRTNGMRCGRPAIRGGSVCHQHGGAAPQVKAKAKERIREYVAQMVDPGRALQEAARLAYSDVGEFMDEGGNFKPFKEWPEDLRRAVSSIEVVRRNLASGDGHTDDILKVKLWDKSKNLELLFKHMGLLIERSEVTVKGVIEERIKAGRDRLAKGKRGNGKPHA